MNKATLDRWIESTPLNDNFEGYFEDVIEAFSIKFFYVNEDKILNSDTVLKWVEKCFNSDKSPIFAARLIERLHRLYKL